jgi:hypothetical protein
VSTDSSIGVENDTNYCRKELTITQDLTITKQ